MTNPDIVIIGAGISGLSFAWKAAQSGRNILVLEQGDKIGGCIYSCRYDDGFWYELGAHTVYNSYSGLLDIVVESGLSDKLVRRGPARAHFGLLHNNRIDWLTPPKVLLRLNWLSVVLNAPVGFFRSKRGRTVEQYYSGLLGSGNFRKVLSPFFAAVPSQCADGFPVEGPGSLFKKRSRREEFPRSFGFHGGLQTICDAIASHPNIKVRTKVHVSSLSPAADGFEIKMGDGTNLRTPLTAVAASLSGAAALLQEGFPTLSAAIRRVDTVPLESLGARIARDKCRLPECAFVVPVNDLFFSAVTRDPFPDPNFRAFAFHFRSGLTREQKIDRICRLLRVSPSDLDAPAEHSVTLPAPRRNHAEVVADIQRRLEGTGLALMGNYFAGLAIEDCIGRAYSEWNRLQSQGISSKR